MAYPNNFIKITFGGSIFAKKDIWTCGINFGSPTGDLDLAGVKAKVQLGGIPNNVATWFQSDLSSISVDAVLEWVKVAYIGTNGLYELDADTFDIEELVTGSMAVSTYRPIPQHTTAISFETDVRRGAGRFGRIYPPLNGQVDTEGMVHPQLAINMGNATALLLGQLGVNLSAVGMAYIPPIVASQKTTKHNEITKVRVGRVVDTQRSRRNAYPELYSPSVGIEFSL